MVITSSVSLLADYRYDFIPKGREVYLISIDFRSQICVNSARGEGAFYFAASFRACSKRKLSVFSVRMWPAILPSAPSFWSFARTTANRLALLAGDALDFAVDLFLSRADCFTVGTLSSSGDASDF